MQKKTTTQKPWFFSYIRWAISALNLGNSKPFPLQILAGSNRIDLRFYLSEFR